MASEASEPLNGVDRLAPISRLSAPSSMGLELGSLPSTGVTRLPRYYEPLRHPERPGLALTGLRLSSRDSPLGASRVASDLRVQACHCQYPGGTPGACRVVRGNPLCLPGRRPSPYSNRVGSHIGLFRGWHGVHSRCGLPARRAAQGDPSSRRLRRFRYLHRRSDSYRMERPVFRAGFAPAGDPRLVTAHCYRNPYEAGCPAVVSVGPRDRGPTCYACSGHQIRGCGHEGAPPSIDAGRSPQQAERGLPRSQVLTGPGPMTHHATHRSALLIIE